MLISADNTKARRVSDNPILSKGNGPSVGIKTVGLKLETPLEREKWKNCQGMALGRSCRVSWRSDHRFLSYTVAIPPRELTFSIIDT